MLVMLSELIDQLVANYGNLRLYGIRTCRYIHPLHNIYWVAGNYSGMLIGRPIAIMYFLARKITAECAEG